MTDANPNEVAPINHLKVAAANAAVAQLEDGMVIGLGSGSTATLAITAMGKRIWLSPSQPKMKKNGPRVSARRMCQSKAGSPGRAEDSACIFAIPTDIC